MESLSANLRAQSIPTFLGCRNVEFGLFEFFNRHNEPTTFRAGYLYQPTLGI